MTRRERSVPMVFRAIHFGNECLSRRLELKISGDDAAALLPFDKSQLYRYERGLEPHMKMHNFISLCNLYDLDPREFFELEI